MFQRLAVLQMAHDAAVHAAARQGVIARNVAHADTPGFRAQDLPSFAATLREGGAGTAALLASRPGHLDAHAATRPARPVVDRGAAVNPNGNSVALDRELMRAAMARQDHDTALTVYRSVTGILRAALG